MQLASAKLVKALEVGKPAGQGLVLGIWFLFMMVGLGRGVIWWKGVNCVMDSAGGMNE